MKKQTTIAAVLALAGCASLAHAQSIDIGPIVNLSNGNTYYRLTNSTWTQAQAFAQTLGGNLVTINDAAENEWVRATFAATTPTIPGRIWIGLNDAAAEGQFVWAAGEPVGFTNWDAGEPNNNGNEDYALMYNIGVWADVVDSTNPPGIGEVYGVVEVQQFFSIPWFTIDSGGGQTSGGTIELNASIGQPDASEALAGGQFTIVGGFWAPFEVFCPADFNRDGSVDFFDYLDFVSAFDSEAPAADFNGDSAVDFFDYLDFVAAFDAQC
jgi:hypothetical protein